jgi:hypothetical protein
MSGGQQANFGQGAVNVLGDETEGTMVGSSSTASPGSFGKSVFMRLRSKKIIDSATSRTLTGSALSGLQGAFGRTRSKALTGTVSSGATGTIVYTPGSTPPPDPSEFLVDEVASETLLASHADVRWHSSKSTLGTLVGGSLSGPADFYLGQVDWPTNAGHDESTVQQESTYGNLYSLRCHSSYPPSHFLNGYVGGRRIYGDINSASLDVESWLNHNKYSRTVAGITPSPSAVTFIGSSSLTDVYLRMGIYLESSIFAGHTETGLKLGGFEIGHINVYAIMWLRKAPTGNTRWELECYWNGGLVDVETAGLNTDLNIWGNGQWRGAHGGTWFDGSAKHYLYPDTWHTLEMHFKLNSSAGVADGIREVRLDDRLILQHLNCKVHKYTGANPIEHLRFRNQLYHGGQNVAPASIMWAKTAGWAVADRWIGKPLLTAPQLTRNLNNALWTAPSVFGGWTDAQTRVDMQYSNAHQHTDGRQLEFSMALHSRAAGDNTGVRWAQFDSHLPPTLGYYWDNDDVLISEHDNFPTAYLPWKGWVALFGRNSEAQVGGLVSGQKIISIDGTPSAIFRNVQAAGTGGNITDIVDVVYPTGTGLTAISPNDAYHNTNYNPACWVNPSGTMTGWWGGGYSNSFPNGHGSLFKLLDDNPNYPTSAKQLRLRVFRPTGAPSPLLTRHMVQIGNWLYWGGGFINPDTGVAPNEATKISRSGEFYRIYVPDLSNNVFTQEAITACSIVTLHANLPLADNNIRYNLLCADQTRNWLIYMNINGVYRYRVPVDDGNDGVWDGPHTFGMTSNVWADTISGGQTSSGINWHGLIGTHRADLGRNGMTFFRYNSLPTARMWNKIEWNS